MKIYDFSGTDFGIENLNEEKHVSLIIDDNEQAKILVSDMKNRRLVFNPHGKVLQNKGYSEDEITEIIEVLSEYQEELSEAMLEEATLEEMRDTEK